MLLLDLADVLKSADLEVVEVSGWKTRGHGEMASVKSIICHHTAGPKTGNFPSLKTVRDGRPDLSGPLAQLGLGRDGTWYVIASGVAYHAGVVFETYQNNWHAIGVEAEGTGVDPWPAVQYDSYARGVAALRDAYLVPLADVLGHKEVAKPKGRKTDPNFDMDDFRVAVAAIGISKPKPPPITPPTEGSPLSGLTDDDAAKIGAAVAAALAPKIDAIEQKYTVADNNYDSQRAAYEAVAQAEAAHILAGGAPHTAAELSAAQTPIWSYLRTLWAKP